MTFDVVQGRKVRFFLLFFAWSLFLVLLSEIRSGDRMSVGNGDQWRDTMTKFLM